MIRTMQDPDLPRVMEVEQASFSMPWTEATFRGLLRRTDAELLVAEVDGELVGHAVLWAVTDQGELGNIAVAPAWRGQGIGTRLLVAALASARGRGVHELYLEVRASNARAQQLYERHGFHAVGRRPNYYVDPVEDALVMCKVLAVANHS
ncbi:MAG: ribosomal protein S18-alanine N-acetyltransferase [Gemmatimonadetes bacterium]|nr:ribosomal protein S18-alanine N-acetyltransferase [Gemmatimonadota bacterium]